MTCTGTLSNSSHAAAMRCCATHTASSSNPPAACFGPARHRAPLLRGASRRAPFTHSVVRCAAQQHELPTAPSAVDQPAPVSAQALRRACADSAQLLQVSASLWLLAALPAGAADVDYSRGSASMGSYYATLFLFVSTLPGLWSLVKRAPKASIKRKVFEVPGPGVPGAMPLDARARAIFEYFSKYNYEVKERGEVITFAGNYAASRGQAAALVAYVFFGLASAALVLSIAAPFGGNYWYLITLISPAAGVYYLSKGNRQEEFKVKMVTADDEQTTDIITSGDVEETTRFCRELGLQEKGKEYVKGILER